MSYLDLKLQHNEAQIESLRIAKAALEKVQLDVGQEHMAEAIKQLHLAAKAIRDDSKAAIADVEPDIFPQDVATFISTKELGGEFKIKQTYFIDTPIRIIKLRDERLVVRKVSTGAVCLVENWEQALGVRRAAMERYNAIEAALA